MDASGAVAANARVQVLDARVDRMRIDISRRLNAARKAELGQYFSPASVVRLMASMFDCREQEINILDAGAGIGSLCSGLVTELVTRRERPRTISVTAYELDASLTPHLRDTLELCRAACADANIRFSSDVIDGDFIENAAEQIKPNLFRAPNQRHFNCAILNPPYVKFHSTSKARETLRLLGIETTNMYAAFLAIAVHLLEPHGELVAITPRSFCNGPYFKSFRKAFLRDMKLQRLHVFESREHAF